MYKKLTKQEGLDKLLTWADDSPAIAQVEIWFPDGELEPQKNTFEKQLELLSQYDIPKYKAYTFYSRVEGKVEIID